MRYITLILAAVIFTPAGLFAAEPAAPPTKTATDFDHAIRMCAGEFRSEAYLELAAALQALPQDDAIGWLKKWAVYDVSVPTEGETVSQRFEREGKYHSSAQYEEQVVALCQMLFDPQPGASTRPKLIRHYCVGGTDLSFWPRGPIALVDDIPFYVCDLSRPFGYSGPPPDTAGDYLDYCLKHMDWSKRRYQPATTEQIKNALDKLETTTAWVTPLTEEETKFLANQALPPVYMPPRPMSLDWGANTDTDGYWHTLVRGYSSLSIPQPNGLEVVVRDGHYPFKYTVAWSNEPKSEVITSPRAKLGLWQQVSREFANAHEGMFNDMVFFFDDTVHPPGSTLTVDVEDSEKQRTSIQFNILPDNQVEVRWPDALPGTSQ